MYHDQWLTLNGSQYYFRSWGGRYQNCTATINVKQYKFDASGRRITEGWEYIGKYRRYRKADGSLMEDVTNIFNPSSKYITVDRTRGRVTIYGYNSATGSYDTPIKSMICSAETEVVLPRIESDIIGLFEGIAFGKLDAYELAVSPLTATTVVCVSGGYPGDYVKGLEISGLDKPTESIVFHAGTTAKAGKVLTAGGRVLAVTSLGESIEEAVGKSFDTISGIEYTDKYFRSDIGKDLL